jgi:hypothetical protein
MNKWISVEDKKPNPGDNVLFVDKKTNQVISGYFENEDSDIAFLADYNTYDDTLSDDECYSFHYFSVDEVVCWMPKPEPPE